MGEAHLAPPSLDKGGWLRRARGDFLPVKLEASRKVAEGLGVRFRVREYIPE